MALERFEAPALERLPARPRDTAGRMVRDLAGGMPLPWEPGHAAYGKTTRSQRYEWRHALHIGRYDRDDAYARVEAAFPSADPEAEAERPRRRGSGRAAALLSVALTNDGRPVLDSLEASGAAWSMATTLAGGTERADWLAGWNEVLDELRTAFDRIMLGAGDPALPDGSIDDAGIATQPLTWPHMHALLTAATSILELGGQIAVDGTVRSTSWVQLRSLPPSTDGFLNSDALGDLQRVARNLDDLPAATPLAAFLDAPHAEPTAIERTCTDDNPAAVAELVAPDRYPAGRWPADPAHDLALSQQLAVNVAVAGGSGPITAVNGPPGTGKTTMLRDLIAAVVTERAQRIAECSKPSQVLRGVAESVHGDRVIRVDKLHPDLTGHELLLACATNAAAENVTLELPHVGAIASEFAGHADERAVTVATAALRAALDAEPDATVDAAEQPAMFHAAVTPGADTPDAAWGLIAARLGKRANVSAFARAVWGPTGQAAREGLPADTLQAIFRDPPKAPVVAWREARTRFLSARERVDALRAERLEYDDARRAVAGAEQRLEALAAQIAAADERVSATRDTLEHAEAHLASAETAHRAAELALAEAEARRPGVVARHTKSGKAAEAAYGAAVTAAREAAEHLAAARGERPVARSRARRAAVAVERARLEFDAAREELAEAVRTLDDRPAYEVPGDGWADDIERRELRAPWCDEAWNRARTDCFLAALDLHWATLMACRTAARRSLGIAFDLLAGRGGQAGHEVTLAAWQWLFFLLPVMSTTFASLPRLLAGLRPGDLGWLLIDEAGQVAPQKAVGALWRCQRAVIVGDPMQLEPVSSVPPQLAECIRQRFDLPLACISPEASVQRLADLAMPIGARRGDDDLWVGIPLNVHRRAQQPLAEIVSDLAYGGRMICATPALDAHHALRTPSAWLHVPSAPDGGGHWRAAEGARLLGLLDYLDARDHPREEVFIVSPFRDCAAAIGRIVRDRPGLRGGTVHTTQGQEADVVVLVLGGDPSRPGARQWAVAKPNLLNVAISRARHRLYVIGDRDAWIGLPHVGALAHLPVAAREPARR